MKFRQLAVAALSMTLVAGFIIGSSVKSQAAVKKILVVTHTTGFRHSSIPTSEKVLKELGEKSKLFTVDYCRNGDDVKKMLTPEGLAGYDAVIFSNTTGNLGIPDLTAFLNWIKAGHAFLGMHSASDTYHPNDVGGDLAYVAMVGGEFKTHAAQCEVVCKVEDAKHPAVKDLAPEYVVKDEIYEFWTTKDNVNKKEHFVQTREDKHVLLALDKHPDDSHANAKEPGDYLISWCSMYGKGKVFYTALGHREDVWESEKYQKHVLGAIKWALGLARGSAAPAPMVKPVAAR